MLENTNQSLSLPKTKHTHTHTKSKTDCFVSISHIKWESCFTFYQIFLARGKAINVAIAPPKGTLWNSRFAFTSLLFSVIENNNLTVLKSRLRMLCLGRLQL